MIVQELLEMLEGRDPYEEVKVNAQLDLIHSTKTICSTNSVDGQIVDIDGQLVVNMVGIGDWF